MIHEGTKILLIIFKVHISPNTIGERSLSTYVTKTHDFVAYFSGKGSILE